MSSSNNKDKIINALEDQVRQLDSTIARLNLENKRLKISKAYKLSKTIHSSYGKMRHSIPARAIRKAGRITKKAVSDNTPPVNQIISECYGYDIAKKVGKINVGIICKAALVRPQSSAFIRLISPLTQPSVDPTFSIQLLDGDMNPKTYLGKDIDIFIVQRTAFSSIDNAQYFLGELSKYQIPFVLDIDDAMSLLDKDHVEYSIQKPAIEAMELLINHADQVWCSTDVIASLYTPLNKNVLLTQNSLDERIWEPSKKSRKATSATRPLRIVYMGTVTHQNDFNMIMAALDRVYALHPNSFELTVIGVSDATPRRPYIKSEKLLPGESVYPRFTRWFSNLPSFDIGLSPLENSSFNMAKSDIKCLDYLALGIIPVVSNVQPYSTSHVKKYSVLADNNIEAWTECLAKLIEDPKHLELQRKKALDGQSYVWSKRSSEETARVLSTRIEKLVKKG